MLTPLQCGAALEARHTECSAKTLSQALDSAALEFSERPLVIAESRTYSYRDVQNWSRTLAAGLLECGVEAGDHVAEALSQFPECVAVQDTNRRAAALAVPRNF